LQLACTAAKLDEAQARILKLETAAAVMDAGRQALKQQLSDANAYHEKMTAEIAARKAASSVVQREIEEALAVGARLRAEKETLQTRLLGEGARIKTLEEDVAKVEKQLGKNFSKVICILALHSIHSRALTFEKILGEKRREAQTMMDDYHSLEQDLGSKAVEEAEARSKLLEATKVWDTARVSYQEYNNSMRARMAEAAEAAQNMYVAICRPSVGPATGLGIVLAAAEGARHPVIHELVEGGIALASGKMNVGDALLAMNGVAMQDLTLEEINLLLCGAVGSKVTFRAQASGDETAYEVELVRKAGGVGEAGMVSLVSSLLPEAVRVAAIMHQELEDLRARGKEEALQLKEASLRWQTESGQLHTDLLEAQRRLQLMSKEAEEVLADKQGLETELRQQRADMQRKTDEAKAATGTTSEKDFSPYSSVLI
jgi:chromosome segregation ATPase